MSQARLSCS